MTAELHRERLLDLETAAALAVTALRQYAIPGARRAGMASVAESYELAAHTLDEAVRTLAARRPAIASPAALPVPPRRRGVGR